MLHFEFTFLQRPFFQLFIQNGLRDHFPLCWLRDRSNSSQWGPFSILTREEIKCSSDWICAFYNVRDRKELTEGVCSLNIAQCFHFKLFQEVGCTLSKRPVSCQHSATGGGLWGKSVGGGGLNTRQVERIVCLSPAPSCFISRQPPPWV